MKIVIDRRISKKSPLFEKCNEIIRTSVVVERCKKISCVRPVRIQSSTTHSKASFLVCVDQSNNLTLPMDKKIIIFLTQLNLNFHRP